MSSKPIKIILGLAGFALIAFGLTPKVVGLNIDSNSITNLVDLLDPALRRRFDREIEVDRPDRAARNAYLNERLLRSARHRVSAVVVDRLALTDKIASRLHDALEQALDLSEGEVRVLTTGGEEILLGSRHACQACGLSFEQIEPRILLSTTTFGPAVAIKNFSTKSTGDRFSRS